MLGLAVVLFVVLFWQLGRPSFWDPDEGHYAETSREMLATGDWWAPFYNEQPFFDKPVLFHQLQATAMAAFGPNELGARFVPALAALAIVGITFWVGVTFLTPDAAWMAALLMATSPGLFALARYAILDTLFTAFLFGGAALVTAAALRGRRELEFPGYVLVAFALMTKGPLALVLCGLTFLIAMAVSSDARRRLLQLRWGWGLAVVVLLAAPWFVYMYFRFRDGFVNGYIFDENLNLFATTRFAKQPPPWFYVQILAAGLLPWTGVLVGRLVDGVRSVMKRATPDTFEVLLWSWTAAIVGFFTLSHFKLDHYVFPAAPALCLLCARAWADVRTRPFADENKGALFGLYLVGPLLVVIGLGGGYFMIERLELPLAVMVVPTAITAAGAFVSLRLNIAKGRLPPRVPWVVVGSVVVAYAGILLWIMPALEARKVVPDLARWVAAHADGQHRVASYRLNRWNPAFRFYVNHHTTMLETVEEARAFFEQPGAFYCAMLQPAYEEFVANGVPLTVVTEREGMWATSGRALWRRRQTPTRFVVVTLSRQMEGDAGHDQIGPEQQRALDQ